MEKLSPEDRYIVKQSNARDAKIYPYMVWDSKRETFIALASTESMAQNYAAQMNGKGYIEVDA